MKRIVFIATGMASWLLVAGTALAQDGSDLGPPGGSEVGGIGGGAGVEDVGAGSAFTGDEIAGLIVLAWVFLMVGAAVVLLAKKHPLTDR